MLLPVHLLVLLAAVEGDVAAGAALIGGVPAHGAQQELAIVCHFVSGGRQHHPDTKRERGDNLEIMA